MSVNRLRRAVERNEGQALVEFALILPILLVLIMGIIEFGRIFFSYLVITELAREGARYGVVGHTEQQIVEHLEGMASVLDPEKLVIDVTPNDGERVRGQGLTVEIDYTVDLIGPFIGALLPDPFPVVASCTMRLE
ncbi:TadE/TadG family type IV pilus assembly protein [Syntrophothermus lipocalidus]|uniref:TadE family protein n=1 Tax=Syntrophothermus lipocalidus (strain DSM 12680 / TGB-C1) TaxID=643648 RepID=D7CPP8_SYNLT|nr:TadE family protein [Syntrophothermus lipocalidus]ADI02676.1 TadE family protein [Syntrophothermus lipocalidus DSM 12680]